MPLIQMIEHVQASLSWVISDRFMRPTTKLAPDLFYKVKTHILSLICFEKYSPNFPERISQFYQLFLGQILYLIEKYVPSII